MFKIIFLNLIKLNIDPDRKSIRVFYLYAVGRPKEGCQVVNLEMGYRDSSYRQKGEVAQLVERWGK